MSASPASSTRGPIRGTRAACRSTRSSSCYTSAGALIKRVDNACETGTELAQHERQRVDAGDRPRRELVPERQPRAPTRVTPTFVDNVPPVATVANAAAGATEVSRFVEPVVKFSEAVSGVSGATVQLRDLGTDLLVPATLTYDKNTREARIAPDRERSAPSARSASRSAQRSRTPPASRSPTRRSRFSTNAASFTDTHGTPFAYAIEWLVASGITFGCTRDRVLPDPGGEP